MKLDEVSQNYDKASRYYDRLTDFIFGHILALEKYRIRAIDLLGDLEGATVLDLGCGTGRSFPLLVNRVGERGSIIGIDYSEGMLKQARRRILKNGWHNIKVIRGDAARLENVLGPVDAISAVWCLGIVDDLDTALERSVGLLRKGGCLSIVDFGKARPDHGILRWLFPVYHAVLRYAGIDSAEDLDNAKLQAKWAQGKDVLKRLVGNYHEESYLKGAGLIIVARKP